MKRNFNKKKLLTFGLLGIFALALVSALVVDYLSNTVQADVEIKSPIVQSISENVDENDNLVDGSDTISLPVMYTGGENTFTFYVETDNIANVAITGNAENIVRNWAGVTCEDFASVLVTTITDDPAIPYDLKAMGLCSQGVDDNHVVFSYGPVPIVWEAGETDVTEVIVTFNDVIGKYVITSQIVPVLD